MISAPNPLARYAPCAISNQGHASKYAVRTYLVRVDSGVPAFGEAFATWDGFVPGRPRTLTLNKATNPLWTPDDGVKRTPAEVYAAYRNEFAVVHAAGCEMVILDAEFDRTSERDAEFNDVVLAAIRDAMPGTPYCNFAAIPWSPHEGRLWPDDMLAQVPTYGWSPQGITDPYTRLCEEINQYAMTFVAAPHVPAIGYVGSSYVADARFTAPFRAALYRLAIAASGGVVLAFDQDDPATLNTDEGAECVAMLDAAFADWLAVTGGQPVKAVTRVESDRYCCRVVVQLLDGSLAAVCLFHHPTKTETRIADGLGGSMLMPATHDDTLTVMARKVAQSHG